MSTADAGVVARRSLPGHPSSAGAARRTLRAAVADAVPPAVAETAELLVSELVTNAVVHAATDITLVVAVLAEDRVRVQVSDGSRQAPARRDYRPTATTGRGLRLLQELADTHGTTRSSTGKTVWFEVGPGSTGPGSAATIHSPDDESAAGAVVPVVLLDLPPTLCAAWLEQADALLRDHLLATLEDSGAEENLARHAACSAAIALLAESLPDGGAGADGALVDVVMPVPLDTVSAFDLLQQTLDRAIAKADAGALLAPATDAPLREVRRWVCREVRRQAGGGQPAAWHDG